MKLALATVILFASAATAQATPLQPPPEQAASPPVRAITFCRDAQSVIPDTALNDYSPISGEFLRKIGRPYKGTTADARPYRVALLQRPTHGQVQLLDEPSQHWTYVPEKDYTGTDRVVYAVESKTKRYKVVINFWVVEVIDESRKRSECESKKLSH